MSVHCFTADSDTLSHLNDYCSLVLKALVAIVVIDALVLASWWASDDNSYQQIGALAAEGGLLEILQGVLLGLAALLCFYASGRVRDRVMSRYLNFGLGLLFVMLFLRETEIDSIGVSAGWETAEVVIRAVAVLVAVVYALKLIPLVPALLKGRQFVMASKALPLMVIGVLFYCAGWPFDKNVFMLGTDVAMLIEEILEFNACLSFGGAAIAAGAESDPIYLI